MSAASAGEQASAGLERTGVWKVFEKSLDIPYPDKNITYHRNALASCGYCTERGVNGDVSFRV